MNSYEIIMNSWEEISLPHSPKDHNFHEESRDFSAAPGPMPTARNENNNRELNI
jgi:hypothetical protein